MAINRDPVVWGEDSDLFIPDRWLDPSRLPPPDKTVAGFVGTATFIEGPRMCIGYRLGVFGHCENDVPVAHGSTHPSGFRVQGDTLGPRQAIYLRGDRRQN